MVHREIEIDEEADRILTQLATNYEGDCGKALSDLLRASESIESFLDENEAIHRDSLLAQVERSERGFREGRFTTWEEVKRRNGL
jgi:hypothetical protein